MTATPNVEWLNDAELQLGDTSFVAVRTKGKRFESTRDRFCVVKRPDLVRKYVALVGDLAPRRIVELGIWQGGSTALLAALTRPECLVAVELRDQRIEALDAFLADHDLMDAVHPFYGVDQGNSARLREILDGTLGDDDVDLVIDDASHDLDLTRSSFNVLFPRIRPGGLFVIEDWSWAHLGYGVARPHDVPLTTLVFELVMALPSQLGLIDDIAIDRDWAVIRRGPLPLDADSFDVSECYTERGRRLVSPFAFGLSP
jgi:hypothetical protein